MLSHPFKEEPEELSKEEIDAEIEEHEHLQKLIEMLESWAEPFLYLDDYPILVLEASSKPIIIMNPDTFRELEERVIGRG